MTRVKYQFAYGCCVFFHQWPGTARELCTQLRKRGFLPVYDEKKRWVLARNPKGGCEEIVRALRDSGQFRLTSAASFGWAGLIAVALAILTGLLLIALGAVLRDQTWLQGSWSIYLVIIPPTILVFGLFSILLWSIYRSERPTRPVVTLRGKGGACDLCTRPVDTGRVVWKDFFHKGVKGGLRPDDWELVKAAHGFDAASRSLEEAWLAVIAKSRGAKYLLCAACCRKLEQCLLVPAP